MKTFSGGGVLPIVSILEGNKQKLFFLTFSSRRGVLSDAGGKCDPGENIEKTCVREFYEESCKLFDIDSASILNHKYIDINAGLSFYRSYFPLFNFEINKNYFSDNRRVLKSNFCRYFFLEKTELVLVPVDSKLERLNHNSNKIYTTTDSEGKSRLVNRRLYKLIREFRKLQISPDNLLLEKKQTGELLTYHSKQKNL